MKLERINVMKIRIAKTTFVTTSTFNISFSIRKLFGVLLTGYCLLDQGDPSDGASAPSFLPGAADGTDGEGGGGGGGDGGEGQY